MTAAEALRLPARHEWQHSVGLALALAFFGVCAHAFRRARDDPERAAELTYAALLATTFCGGLFIQQPLTLIGASLAALIIVTAPRLLRHERIDRWVLAAVLSALALAALELLEPVTQAREETPIELYDYVFVVAAATIGAFAVRNFPLYPLRSKFTLASLLIALAPMLAARADSQRLLLALDAEAALQDLSYETSTAASEWDTLLVQRRAALRALAESEPAAAACLGDPDGLAQLQRRLGGLVAADELLHGAALYDPAGRRLLAVGIGAPLSAHPPRAVELAGEAIVITAPVARDVPLGALALSLRPGLLRGWSERLAPRSSVVLRDLQRRVLLSSARPELLPELPSAPTPPAVPTPEKGRAAASRLAGGRGLVAVAAVPAADWSLALLRDETLPNTHRTDRLQWLTLLVTALVALGAFLLSRRLAAPISQLAAAMARFTSGETDVRAPFAASDELGELARRFDLMAAQVGGLVRSLEQQTQRLQVEVRERSEQERRLQALNAELTAATDKAEAASRTKSTFLAHMSHELRTPLTAIIGYGELLHDQAREQGEDELVRDTGHIIRAAQHLLEIINDILVLSKIEAGKLELHLEEFDAAKVAREVAELVRPMVGEGRNHLFVRVDREPARMFSDRLKLRQALLNLLSNAAKFTADGEVALTLEHQSVGGLPCIVFGVRDTGVGIPPHALPTLFDPFTQVAYPTVRKQSGTGLGLAITRRLCRQMGGEIDVVSELGAGSSFTLTIPAVYKGSQDSDSWRPLRAFRGTDDSGTGKHPR